MPVLSTNARAVFWVLLSTAVFSVVFASGKIVGGSASTAQVMLIRYIAGFLTMVVVAGLAVRRDPTVLRAANRGAHFARALFGCFGAMAIIYATTHIPAVDASALGMLYVVFVVPLGVLVFKERLGSMQILAIVVSTIGASIVMISKGAFQGFNPTYLWPASFAVLGAAFMAGEGILIRKLSLAESPISVMLHVSGFGVLLMIGPALMDWQPIGLEAIAFLILLGPLALLGQLFTILGYRMADIAVVGPIDYTWMIFAAAIGFFLFGEVPSQGVLIGAALIVAGGIVLMRPKTTQIGTAQKKRAPQNLQRP